MRETYRNDNAIVLFNFAMKKVLRIEIFKEAELLADALVLERELAFTSFRLMVMKLTSSFLPSFFLDLLNIINN